MIVFNIGYRPPGDGYSILNKCPIVSYDSLAVFCKELRKKKNIKTLFKWAKDSYVPPSMMHIFITIIDGDFETEFKIRLMGVREYKTHWNNIYQKG